MSIQPIDLQTLFVKMHHVGKEQVAQKEAAVIQQEIQGNEMVKKHQHDDSSVNRADISDKGPENVKEDGRGSTDHGAEHKKSKEEKARRKEKEILFDPDLGKNIDFSG